MALSIAGKASWFGGPHDSQAGGAPASGLGWIPGIAVYNHATLGGYWSVTAPNGRTNVLPQIDLGPAPWTGRVVDISFNAVPLFGYSEGSFPTDQGTWHLTYEGKNKPAGTGASAAPPASAALSRPGGTPVSTAGGSAASTGAAIDTLFKTYQDEVNTPRTAAADSGFVSLKSAGWQAPFQWWWQSFVGKFNAERGAK